MSDDAVVAQVGPYQVELEAGKAYFWCRCGRSTRQPFCDAGGHKGTPFAPLAERARGRVVANLCGCKSTDDQPFCDGAHNML